MTHDGIMLEKMMGMFGLDRKPDTSEIGEAPEIIDEELTPIELRNEVKRELKKYRKQFEGDWKIFEDFYYGKQHKTGEDRKTTKNHIFRIIESEVPIMTDSMPGTVIIAQDEARDPDAKMLESGIKYVYRDQSLALLMPSLVRDSLIAAPGLLYLYFDPNAEKGQGKIRFKQVDWRNIYFDGNAQTLDDSTKFAIMEPMRKGEAQALWPEKHEEIEDDEGEDAHEDDNSGASFDQYEDKDLSQSQKGEVIGGRPKDFKAEDVGTYGEVWVKSYDLEEIPMGETVAEIEKENQQISNGEVPDVGKYEDHATHMQGHLPRRMQLVGQLGIAPDAPFEEVQAVIEQIAAQSPDSGVEAILLQVKLLDDHMEIHKVRQSENPEGKRLKYPDGWRVIKTYNNVLLEDGPNPPGIDEIPLVPFYAYKDKTIYGFGEVKNIHNPQTSLNEMDYKEYKGLKRVSNPGWVADSEAGVDENKLTSEEGIVVTKPRGTDVRRLEPGNISPQLSQRADRDELAIEKISGIREETQGAMPSPNASGFAINKLQLQSVGRIRLKDRMLAQYSMHRLGRLTAKFIMAYWNAEKRLRFRTDDNQIQTFFFDPMAVKDLEYSIEISEGSMAGVDKDSLNNLYAQFLAAGHIDFMEFLSVADIPKKSIIVQMVKDRMDKDAQLQDMQKQMIQLKGAVNPQLLTPEEQAAYTEMQRQAANEQLINGGIGSLQQANPTSGQGV